MRPSCRLRLELAAFYYILFFFFNDTATTEIYTLSLHDALPIFAYRGLVPLVGDHDSRSRGEEVAGARPLLALLQRAGDRKSTRLNSSHSQISYAVFCLKKKKNPDLLESIYSIGVIVQTSARCKH